MDDVVQRVIRLIAENQQIDAETITIDSSFEELGVDSFDGVNLLFSVEGEFDVSVSDEQAKQLRSVRDVVDGVRQLLAAKSGQEDSDAAE